MSVWMVSMTTQNSSKGDIRREWTMSDMDGINFCLKLHCDIFSLTTTVTLDSQRFGTNSRRLAAKEFVHLMHTIVPVISSCPLEIATFFMTPLLKTCSRGHTKHKFKTCSDIHHTSNFDQKRLKNLLTQGSDG